TVPGGHAVSGWTRAAAVVVAGSWAADEQAHARSAKARNAMPGARMPPAGAAPEPRTGLGISGVWRDGIGPGPAQRSPRPGPPAVLPCPASARPPPPAVPPRPPAAPREHGWALSAVKP